MRLEMSDKDRLSKIEVEADLEYACVLEKTPKFDKKGTGPKDLEFRVTLVMTEQEKDTLEALFKENNVPLTVGNPNTMQLQPRIQAGEDGKFRLTVRRNAYNKNGQEVHIDVRDAALNLWPKTLLIGNGSRAFVEILVRPNAKKGKENENTINLMGLQVISYKPYVKPTSFKKREGFSVDGLLPNEGLENHTVETSAF